MTTSFVFITSKKLFFKQKANIEIYNAASTRRHWKYVGFPWFPVVATHDRKRLAQALA
jgi:hypothetical protein